MASHEYSPVGVSSSSSSPTFSGEANNKKAVSRLALAVVPLFHFLLDPVLHLVPSSVLRNTVQVATVWQRCMKYQPFRKLPVWKYVTVAHVVLSIPLIWWFVHATEIAFLRPTVHHGFKNTGKMASYAILAAFLTASKSNSLVSLVTGLSFERLVNFHLASALCGLWIALCHSIQIGYYHKGEKADHHHDEHEEHGDHDHDDHDHDDHDHDDHDHDHEHHLYHRILHHDSIHAYLGPDPNLSKYFFDGGMNRSGFIVLASLAVVIVTSIFHPIMRKCVFEIWLIYHVTCVLLILIAGMVHGADVFWFAIFWWALDLVIRYAVMAFARYPRRATMVQVAENVTKLEFPKPENFKYEGGQFLQISIPTVKMWEFHPFSIASAPHEDKVTIYVRALVHPKTWTRQLYDLAEARDENKISTSSHRIYLEGPYGSVPSIIQHPNQYSMAVFISGGIGVTPCRGIAQSLISSSKEQQSSLKKIWYIWSVRDEAMVKAIPPPKLTDFGMNGKSESDDDDGIELVERGELDLDENDTEIETNGNDNHEGLGNGSAPSALTIQTDIYVTQTSKFLDEGFQDHEDKSNDDKNEEVDTPYELHEGRPDIQAIINELQNDATKNGWGRIFVMGCGPMKMLQDIQAACYASQSDSLQIDYHQEVFDY